MNRLLFRINQLKDQLSSNELRIADFLQHHSSLFLNSSTVELAELTETSPSAWNRFAKKLGYKGTVELKVEMAKASDISTMNHTSVDIMVQESDTTETIIEKYKKITDFSIENTVRLLDSKMFEKVVDELLQAKRIFLFGVGGSATIAFDFLQKISRIGKLTIFQSDIHTLLPNLSNIQPNDLYFAISYSGETAEVLLGAEIAKERGAKVVCVTSYQKNSLLAKISDYQLYIPIVEREIRLGAISSRNSSFFITDLLYLALAAKNLDETMHQLVYSHDKAVKLKGRK